MDLTKHLIDYQGKPYLPVVWRVCYFREKHPNFSFNTEITMGTNSVMAKAIIKDVNGNVLSTAHKTKPLSDKDAVAKAETGAIGRALGFFGVGTEFATQDLEEGDDIVDQAVSKQIAQVNSTLKAETKTPAVKALDDALKGIPNSFNPQPAKQEPKSDAYKTQYDSKAKGVSTAQVKRLWAIAISKKISNQEVNRMLADSYGFTDPNKLNWKQYKDFIEFLEASQSLDEIPMPTEKDMPPIMNDELPF